MVEQGKSSTPSHTIYDLVAYLWGRKLKIALIPAVFTVVIALWTLSLPDIYRSDALLSPTEEAQGGGLNGVMGQLGGIASLTGINIGSENIDKITIAIAILESRLFAKRFIKKYNLEVPLIAAKSWDPENKTLIIDNEIYDQESNEWVKQANDGQPFPSDQELYEQFSQMLDVERDSLTGLVSISVNYYSPYLAENWLTKLISEINEEMRQREIESAKQNIEYLQSRVENLQNVEMVKVFYQIIEQETRELMLAEVAGDFVFKVIDPPVVILNKHEPKRALICVIAGMLCGFLVVSIYISKFLMGPITRE